MNDQSYKFRLSRYGSAFSTRERGLRVLADLQVEAAREHATQVIVDFEGVRMMSFSFANAFFGTLAQRASDAGGPHPIAVGLTEESVREQVTESLHERGLKLHERLLAAAV